MFLKTQITLLCLAVMSLTTIPMVAQTKASSITYAVQEDPVNDVQIKIPEGWKKVHFKKDILQKLSYLDTGLYGASFVDATREHQCFVLLIPDDDEDSMSSEELIESNAKIQTMIFPESKTVHRSLDTLRQVVWGTFRVADDDDDRAYSGGIACYPYKNYLIAVITFGIDHGQQKLMDIVNTFIPSINIVPKAPEEPLAVEQPKTEPVQAMEPAVTAVEQPKTEPVQAMEPAVAAAEQPKTEPVQAAPEMAKEETPTEPIIEAPVPEIVEINLPEPTES